MTKMFGYQVRKKSSMNGREGQGMRSMAKDNPPNYEGKEHVKYKNPGFTRHKVNLPEDEPHMKSHVSRNEEHEMEDNYHMGVPDQTKHTLAKNIKRAMMKMDMPDQEDPDELQGNIVHNVGVEGEEDTSGLEQMGPNYMQKAPSSKEHRKKMISAVMKKKMKKPKKDESDEEQDSNRKRVYGGTESSY